MKVVYCLNSFESYFPSLEISEYLCGVLGMSRLGRLDYSQLKEVAKKNRIVLNWDLLMTSDIFDTSVSIVESLIDYATAVRVNDLGALHYIHQHHRKIPIQLSLEAKGRNLNELLFWQNYLGDQLERVVLSNEISFEKLSEYISKLKVPVEILGVGPIRLAYTPRKLFKSEHLTLNSLESSHKGYSVIQNEHGTQLFHVKDLSLLENLEDLRLIDLGYLRIEPTEGVSGKEILDVIFGRKKEISFKKMTTRGFFKSNRSDCIFSKLKNENIVRVDENYIGDVVEVNKGNYIAIMLRNVHVDLSIGDHIHLKTPDGKDKFATVHWLKNSLLEDLDKAECDQLVLMNHVKGVSVRTACYLCHD